MDWCVTGDFKQANHNPVAVLNGDKSKNVLEITGKPGETIRLSAAETSDPDGNAVKPCWWIYREAGSLKDPVKLSDASGPLTSVVLPQVQQPATLHIILEVSDNGTPVLWAYRRAVITIQP
jgi:hypothetical protein